MVVSAGGHGEARGSEKANGPFGQVLVSWREKAERVS